MHKHKGRGTPGRMSLDAGRHKVGTRKRINAMGKAPSGLGKARNKKVLGNKKIISSMRGK